VRGLRKNCRLAFDGETGWALKQTASLAVFAVGVPKKCHLHSATAAHWQVIHRSPLSRSSRSSSLDRHPVRLRQAQVAGRTIEDMEIREAAAAADRAREDHRRHAVWAERGNHVAAFQVCSSVQRSCKAMVQLQL
jgi:hypothetical protein